MYLYLLPLPSTGSKSPTLSKETTVARPTSDGGKEVTSAIFEDPAEWLSLAHRGDVILFPPQYYLLNLLSEIFSGAKEGSSANPEVIQQQRRALDNFLSQNQLEEPTADKRASLSGRIAWRDKVMSPMPMGLLDDGRVVLALDSPGPELKEASRDGDHDRVVVLKFTKGIPRELGVMKRSEATSRLRARQDVKLFKM